MPSYDAIIIGTGQSGPPLAARLAGSGMKVAIIERKLFGGTCVKVAFPLPNGYALVVMKPESHADGSFTLRSEGERFGDPGFYFFVEAAAGRGWARYVASLKETIHVFRDERGELRTDHDLILWGARFLKIHYRIRRR